MSLCTIMVDISSKIPSLFILISVFQRISISLYPRSWSMIFFRRSLKINLQLCKRYVESSLRRVVGTAFTTSRASSIECSCPESIIIYRLKILLDWKCKVGRGIIFVWLDLHFDFEISRTESYDQICGFPRRNYPGRNIESNLALFDHQRSRLRHHLYISSLNAIGEEAKKISLRTHVDDVTRCNLRERGITERFYDQHFHFILFKRKIIRINQGSFTDWNSSRNVQNTIFV